MSDFFPCVDNILFVQLPWPRLVGMEPGHLQEPTKLWFRGVAWILLLVVVIDMVLGKVSVSGKAG